MDTRPEERRGEGMTVETDESEGENMGHRFGKRAREYINQGITYG